MTLLKNIQKRLKHLFRKRNIFRAIMISLCGFALVLNTIHSMYNILKAPEPQAINYQITINKITETKEEMENFIIHDLENIELVRKYVEKLPHKETQVKYMNFYGIPLEMGIMINFIESNFSKELSLKNKCVNKVGGDLGSMQINTHFHPDIVDYVKDNDIDAYYKYAYKHLATQTKYAKRKNLEKSMQLAILCWNSKTPSQQKIYEASFLRRCNEDLKKIYGMRVY